MKAMARKKFEQNLNRSIGFNLSPQMEELLDELKWRARLEKSEIIRISLFEWINKKFKGDKEILDQMKATPEYKAMYES